MRIATVIVALVVLALPGEPRADQTDPKLDALFSQLAATEDGIVARTIESRIWDLWVVPTVDGAWQPFAVGMNHMNKGRLEAAKNAFSAAIAAAPEFAEAYNKRATVLFYLGDLSGSVADIQRTLALEPRHFGAMSGLAMISSETGREQAALGILLKTKEIYPAMPHLDSRIRDLQEAIARKRI